MITESRITVRYAETDQMGIAHHSNYAVWYEAARGDWIKTLGISYKELEKKGVMLPLLELQCEYKKAAYYEDELIIKTYVRKLSPIQLQVNYEIYKDGSEKPINCGMTRHAWVDLNMNLINLKKKFPEYYEIFLGAVEESIRG